MFLESFLTFIIAATKPCQSYLVLLQWVNYEGEENDCSSSPVFW